MKTFNTHYSNKYELKRFIKNNQIIDSKGILLQIFTGVCDGLYIETLLFEIQEFLPSIQIIGSTTSGEILEDSVSDKQTVLSFSIFEKTIIKVSAVDIESSSSRMAKNLIDKITDPQDAKVVIAFSDGLHTNGELFLETFNKYLPNVTVAGGLAGDNAIFDTTYIFTHDGICNGAICATLYGEDLAVSTTYSFGWNSISKEFIVTQADKNRVYKINDYTPAELYAKYLGENIQKQLPATGIEFPLIVERYGRKIARAVVRAEEDGSLVFAGNVKTGDKVWLGYGDAENILRSKTSIYNDIVNNPVESIFVYSCMARKELLGDSITSEILPLQSIAPTSGFFTYGEFYYNANDRENQNQFLNETMTILALSENANKPLLHKQIEYKVESSTIHTAEALSHLISQTTLELNALNEELEARIQEEVKKNLIKDRQILHQAKHAQMGEMMSMIAHQWRQPLSAISSTAISINLKAKLNKLDDATAKDLSEKISGYSQHLSHTIDDFRDFFKTNKEKKKTTYNEVIRSVFNMIEASILNKNIKLTTSLDSTEIINTYPNELKQVLLNLIKNSEEVLIEKNIKNPEIVIKSFANTLSVRDNGGGIADNIIEKIFDPYFSTKTKNNGTGLGLYMSKTIIEDHCGGTLSVANCKDEDGAIFTIEL